MFPRVVLRALISITVTDDNGSSGKGSVFSLIAFPMVAFVILGLVETANNMSDPFGQDLSLNFNQNAIANSMYEGRPACLMRVKGWEAWADGVCGGAESKKLCEEPDEDFLDHLGDPAFNPTRNPDGSLSAAVTSTPRVQAVCSWGVEGDGDGGLGAGGVA